MSRSITRKTITSNTYYYECANEHRFKVVEPRDFKPPMLKRAKPPQASFNTHQAKAKHDQVNL